MCEWGSGPRGHHSLRPMGRAAGRHRAGPLSISARAGPSRIDLVFPQTPATAGRVAPSLTPSAETSSAPASKDFQFALHGRALLRKRETV